MNDMVIALIFVMGLGVGVLSGMMGVGGGVVMVPAMVFFFSINQHLAQGISLLVIIPTAVVGVWTLHKKGLVDFRLAGYLAAGSILGSAAGANFAQVIPALELKKVFGIFLMIIGIRMLSAAWKTFRANQDTASGTNSGGK